MEKKSIRVGQLVDDRRTGKLEENFMWIAQAMILCTLPYSALQARSVVRKARLGDGSTLTVTFAACIDGISLPYGSDRRLLFWIFDKILAAKSPTIAWDSARQYLDEMNLARSGRNNQLLQESFRRLAGMNINIERRGGSGTLGMNRSIFDDYYLPKSVCGIDDSRQMHFDGIEAHHAYGIRLNQRLFEELTQNPLAVPRSIWADLGGSAQVQDLVLWLYIRCYAARSESMIPWDSLADQFSRDSNARRQRSHAIEAVTILRRLWLGVSLEVTEIGLLVNKPFAPMLADRLDRNRRTSLSN